MIQAEGPHRLPQGHPEVCARVRDAARQATPPCVNGGDHDPDIVYTARLVVYRALCLRCGLELPVGRPGVEVARAAPRRLG